MRAERRWERSGNVAKSLVMNHERYLECSSAFSASVIAQKGKHLFWFPVHGAHLAIWGGGGGEGVRVLVRVGVTCKELFS